MSMHIDTENRRAFELVTQALLDIDRYKQLRDRAPLEDARDKLEYALREDPRYLQAHYYAAVADDLIGKSEAAVEGFEKVLQAAPPFTDEVHYNLGVAYYHRYSKRYLDKAIEHFKMVIEKTRNESLLLLARAGLAQAYAMRMIPTLPEDANPREIKRDFDLADAERRSVAVSLMSRARMDQPTRAEIEWAIHNAKAISLMYHSDYFGSSGEKIRDLGYALNELEIAEKFSPRNFALYCNIASAHMRLGYWRSQEPGPKRSEPRWDFEKALERLKKVIEDIRLGYGFAQYELGRTYRLMGDFERALEQFRKALDVTKDRDVSDAKVNREILLAQKKSKDYP